MVRLFGNNPRDPDLAAHDGVGRTVEQYVQLHGNTTSLEEHFEQWVFGDHWKKRQRSLSKETRDYLLSGEYVWEEYKRAKGLADWAAPAIQYCRALENEIHLRLYDHYSERDTFYADARQKGFSERMTLGSLDIYYSYKGRTAHNGLPPKVQGKIRSANHNWPLCEALMNRSRSNIQDFERIIQRLVAEGVIMRRNKLAHGEAILQSDAQALRDTIIGSKTRPGILLWLAENLEPKK